ncbi:NADPH oxidase 4 [Pelobates cultripes]|nr:NADPH oxidase 4 [Pelobates cultripes]
MDEAALAEILKVKEESPFRELDITEFLRKILHEMDFIKSLLEALPKIQLVPTENKLREAVIKPDIDFTVCFNFTSLSSFDPYLLHIHDWLDMNRFTPGRVDEKMNAPHWFGELGMTRTARQYVKEFYAFFCANLNNNRTQFVVSSLPDTNNLGISIYLYEEGELINTNFKLPSQPYPMVITMKTHNTIELSLRPAELGRESIKSFRVEHKCVHDDVWLSLNVQKTEKIEVTGLNPNTSYEFRYAAVCSAGHSVMSEVTAPEKTLPTCPPVTPRAIPEMTSIVALWKTPSIVGTGVKIKQYRVQYKVKNSKTWLDKCTEGNLENCVIEGLKKKIVYEICVCAICGDDGESAPSEEIECETLGEGVSTAAHRLLRQSKLLTQWQPSVYKLQADCRRSGYPTFSLGRENPETLNKAILLIGEMGSGKTTLINGMTNYILGVDWKDEFRFKLVHEVMNQSEAHSQDSPVTVYKLNYESGYKIPYSFTLIDTPGFGDTQGMAQDKKITEAINDFLISDNGIDQINAVCFVVQSSLARLTPTQKYILDFVCSLLGNLTRDSIFFLITFCDGDRPPVLEAIKAADIPCSLDSRGDPKHFKFNNSALFAENTENETKLNHKFWAVGEEAMRVFFQWLNTEEAKGFRITRELLNEQKGVKDTLQHLQSLIKAGLSKVVEIRTTQRALQANIFLQATNKDFTSEIETYVDAVMPIDNGVINCLQCDFICHCPCTCNVTSEDLSKCSSMDKKGSCLNCPGKCSWQTHFIERHTSEKVKQSVQLTDGQKAQTYHKSCQEIERLSEELSYLQEMLSTIKKATEEVIHQYCRNLEDLYGIVLENDFFQFPDHITLIIQSEKEAAKPGNQARLRALEQVRETAQSLQKIFTEDDTLNKP